MRGTLDNPLPPAVICRERGWKVGDRLIGDEGYGPEVIVITAIGAEKFLARREDGGREGVWCLDAREWRLA